MENVSMPAETCVRKPLHEDRWLAGTTVQVYEGEWRHGRIHGSGTLKFSDGDEYIGQWADGAMDGVGTYTYACGDYYEGGWRADKRHGHGVVVYVDADGARQESYEGTWHEGCMHGEVHTACARVVAGSVSLFVCCGGW